MTWVFLICSFFSVLSLAGLLIEFVARHLTTQLIFVGADDNHVHIR